MNDSRPTGPQIINGPDGALEAEVARANPQGPWAVHDAMVIVAHPHPLHGGSMQNKVVTTLARCYRDLGVDVLRFNFRGVGNSEGNYDAGNGEVDDVVAAAEWAKKSGYQVRLLAGFSFGSSMAAQASYALKDIAHLVLVAPPVERYPYERNGTFNQPVCVIQGGLDDVVDPAGVKVWFDQLQGEKQMLWFDEAGHFFHGGLTGLKQGLAEALSNADPLEG